MGETTLTAGATFGAATGEILAREPSGGRLAFEEVARLLARDIGAAGVVICVHRRETERTELRAVWALDGYAQVKLERDAASGALCGVLERHRPIEVDATRVWDFDAADLGFDHGLAVPVADGGFQAMVCAFYDEDPDRRRAVAAAAELAPFLPRLAG
jgi:hypothetical protein